MISREIRGWKTAGGGPVQGHDPRTALGLRASSDAEDGHRESGERARKSACGLGIELNHHHRDLLSYSDPVRYASGSAVGASSIHSTVSVADHRLHRAGSPP